MGSIRAFVLTKVVKLHVMQPIFRRAERLFSLTTIFEQANIRLKIFLDMSTVESQNFIVDTGLIVGDATTYFHLASSR